MIINIYLVSYNNLKRKNNKEFSQFYFRINLNILYLFDYKIIKIKINFLDNVKIMIKWNFYS